MKTAAKIVVNGQTFLSIENETGVIDGGADLLQLVGASTSVVLNVLMSIYSDECEETGEKMNEEHFFKIVNHAFSEAVGKPQTDKFYKEWLKQAKGAN